jgi:hypothetical protein
MFYNIDTRNQLNKHFMSVDYSRGEMSHLVLVKTVVNFATAVIYARKIFMESTKGWTCQQKGK